MNDPEQPDWFNAIVNAQPAVRCGDLLCDAPLTAEAFERARALIPKPPPPLLMPGGQLTREEAAEMIRIGPRSHSDALCAKHGWSALEPCPHCMAGDAPTVCRKHGWNCVGIPCPKCISGLLP